MTDRNEKRYLTGRRADGADLPPRANVKRAVLGGGDGLMPADGSIEITTEHLVCPEAPFVKPDPITAEGEAHWTELEAAGPPIQEPPDLQPYPEVDPYSPIEDYVPDKGPLMTIAEAFPEGLAPTGPKPAPPTSAHVYGWMASIPSQHARRSARRDVCLASARELIREAEMLTRLLEGDS